MKGTDELLAARQHILEYSIPRAKERVAREQVEYARPVAEVVKQTLSTYDILRRCKNFSSQMTDRPVSSCVFAPNSQMVATATWSGRVQLWNVPTCESLRVFAGHHDRAVSVQFHPQSTLGLSSSSVNLASAGADDMAYLWSLDR